MERTLESIKERLKNKSIKELKDIYKRYNKTNVDLLRGTKSNMINSLYNCFKSGYDWDVIDNYEAGRKVNYTEWYKSKIK